MKMSIDVIHAKRIRSGSLAALVFTGTAMLFVPVCALFGFFALLGANTITLNRAHVTGIAGLLLGLVYGPLFAGIFGLFGWVSAYLGIRLVGHFKPYRIEYVPASEEPGVLAPQPPIIAVTVPVSETRPNESPSGS